MSDKQYFEKPYFDGAGEHSRKDKERLLNQVKEAISHISALQQGGFSFSKDEDRDIVAELNRLNKSIATALDFKGYAELEERLTKELILESLVLGTSTTD